jgi:prephenate dehydratase
MKIGVLGPKGTFSDVAFSKYNEIYPHAKVTYFQTLEETTASLKDLDKIIVPLENTLEGYVQQILDFLIEHQVYIEQELFIYVQFSYIWKSNISDVNNIFVQFAAKGQCQKFIESLKDTDITLTSSNMQSLNRFNHSSINDAAIVPTHIVPKHYHHKNVTDSLENYTRFIVIGKEQLFDTTSTFKVSLVVIPHDDRPGLLYDILSIFKTQKINLTSIMSRPQKNKIGQYNFFIEFISNKQSYQHVETMINLAKDNFTLKILGIYPQA